MYVTLCFARLLQTAIWTGLCDQIDTVYRTGGDSTGDMWVMQPTKFPRSIGNF